MPPAVLLAQTSPYVPNLDSVYQDLDALVAEGLVRVTILGERPYSRLTFARFAQEVRTIKSASVSVVEEIAPI